MGKTRKSYVEESERRKTPRPQPPHADRRTKRERTRNSRERAALRDQRER